MKRSCSLISRATYEPVSIISGINAAGEISLGLSVFSIKHGPPSSSIKKATASDKGAVAFFVHIYECVTLQ